MTFENLSDMLEFIPITVNFVTNNIAHLIKGVKKRLASNKCMLYINTQIQSIIHISTNRLCSNNVWSILNIYFTKTVTTKDKLDAQRQQGKMSWWRTSAYYFKMSTRSTSIALGRYGTGFTKPPTKNIGINW